MHSCGEFLIPLSLPSSSPALTTTKRLAQYESPGPALALLCSSSPPSTPTGSNSGSAEVSGEQMDSMEQTSNGDCMPNTVLGALIAAGGPVLVRCAADREHLAQPACPNAAALSPPIFSGYSEVPVQVQVQVPKSSVVSGLVNCGCYTTNHGKRRCSKRSTTWIFSTGVSGYAHIRGGLLGTGVGRATVTGHFGHAPERCCSNNLISGCGVSLNIFSCTTLAARRDATEAAGAHSRSVTFHRCRALAEVSPSSCIALHCIIPDLARRAGWGGRTTKVSRRPENTVDVDDSDRMRQELHHRDWQCAHSAKSGSSCELLIAIQRGRGDHQS